MSIKNEIYKPSILLVDDTTDSLQLLTQLLRMESYEVRPVLNGTQALQAARHSQPDLILLDILMPDIDGYEVCRQLKADDRTKDIPVIFLTCMDLYENEAYGFELGAVDYIAKPYNSAIVKSRIRTHLQIKIQNDILRQQAEELRIAYAELESFSYSVSHDLKSPLQIIRTYNDFLAEKMKSQEDEEGLGDTLIIRSSCDKMFEIIDDLLKLSRINTEKISVEPVNLSSMAKSIIKELKKMNPERVVEFICKPDIVADADANLIQIAMQNLIYNAWKYTKKEATARIEFGVTQENGKSVFFISDNGIGFDKNDAEQLFVAFKRLSNTRDYEGTGIGLAIVYRVIKRHGGKVWAEGSMGHGASFKFTLGDCNLAIDTGQKEEKGGGSNDF